MLGERIGKTFGWVMYTYVYIYIHYIYIYICIYIYIYICYPEIYVRGPTSISTAYISGSGRPRTGHWGIISTTYISQIISKQRKHLNTTTNNNNSNIQYTYIYIYMYTYVCIYIYIYIYIYRGSGSGRPRTGSCGAGRQAFVHNLYFRIGKTSDWVM